MNYKLTIELVPRTCWYSNVRSNVTKNEWDVIRKKSYEHANHVCEICGDVGTNQGVRHNVECHEIWDYNDETKEQTLLGLISLCPYCHKSKHVGLAQMNGELHIVVNQLMKVNDITEDEALNYINKSFDIWSKRSNFEWKLNTDYLKEYIK
jgi:5-methylcytosine-specific restriction endonuclease McrA